MMKQFAIQYGLTFCLCIRSLYEAPLHSAFRQSIRQLDLRMSYCIIDGLVLFVAPGAPNTAV